MIKGKGNANVSVDFLRNRISTSITVIDKILKMTEDKPDSFKVGAYKELIKILLEDLRDFDGKAEQISILINDIKEVRLNE